MTPPDKFDDLYASFLDRYSRRAVMLVLLFAGTWICSNSSIGRAGFQTVFPLSSAGGVKEFYAYAPIIFFLFTAWCGHAYLMRLSCRQLSLSEGVSAEAKSAALHLDRFGLPHNDKWGVCFLVCRLIVALLPLALAIVLQDQMAGRLPDDKIVHEFIAEREALGWLATGAATVGMIGLWVWDMLTLRIKDS